MSTEKPQIDRFKEAARKLGCDEDEAAFDEKLKRIAGRKPRVAALQKNADFNSEDRDKLDFGTSPNHKSVPVFPVHGDADQYGRL